MKYELTYMQIKRNNRLVLIQRLIVGTLLLATLIYCLIGFSNRVVADDTIDWRLLDVEQIESPVHATLTPNTIINDYESSDSVYSI